MERLTLTPEAHEIVVNGNTAEGAADIFSYDAEGSAGPLGSLFVIGAHDVGSDTMNYMVSLVAAMARREYYADPAANPREAFASALRKVNEIVDEFFQSDGVQLSLGIIGLAGGTVMVSKLDKFRILLARDGEIIDILNNVLLFNKEHLERRRFSNIIHGSIQQGDRLLAYIPSKAITARERSLKSWLVKADGNEFARQCATLGERHASFCGALLHVDIAQTASNPLPVPEQPLEAPTTPEPPISSGMEMPVVGLAWTPRQHHMPIATAPEQAPEEPEPPQIIPSEFAQGIRRGSFARFVSNLRFIRLDGRGKAMTLGAVAVVIIGVILAAKSLWFVSPEEQRLQAVIADVSTLFHDAQGQVNDEPAKARQNMVKALSSLDNATTSEHKDARDLAATIISAMDTLDHAESADVSVVAQLDEKSDHVALALWASTSQSIWAITSADSTYSVVRITEGAATNRVKLPTDFQPKLAAGWRDGLLLIDPTQHKLVRVSNGIATSFELATQENALDMSIFDDNLYVLTDTSILKITSLDTNKPVTKLWLTDASELAPQASRIFVDSNIWTLSTDGTLATYYKGKRESSTLTPIAPSGSWRLVPAISGALAIANADRMRVYIISPTDGTLMRTLKIESEQQFLGMSDGPDGSFLFVTKDNRIWQAK